MADKKLAPSLQDFSLVRTHVEQFTKDFELDNDALGFMFFAIDLILGLQEDEIEDAITDTSYLKFSGKGSGHDRGIDALYIDDAQKPAVVHFFNCKYVEFNKTGNNFPAGEIDKISNFISSLIGGDESIKGTINAHLFSKVQDIWDLYKSQYPKFVIHICSNHYHPFEESEKKRFEKEIGKYSNFKITYDLMPFFVSSLTRKGKQTVNAKLRAIDLNLFEKSDGDIRALIANIDARELLKTLVDDESVRLNADITNYSELKNYKILEDAFEDNVRVYLKQRSRINQNIKSTALSDEAFRFFYYNNGITITCTHFQYPKMMRNPIVELENLQIVNGSQTLHALFDAFSENSDNFGQIDLLVRIYETSKEELSVNIAEYTNSQNPVKSRDIRSNDFVQKKIDKELDALGYFYERKRGQHIGKPKIKRIDAEKAGQALFAFLNKMPAEAKNDKQLIFADKYDEIFSDQITAEDVLITTQIFNEIEARKLKKKKEIVDHPRKYNSESFILHSTYYIMYGISELADTKKISKKLKNYSELISLYDDSISLIKKAIELEKSSLGNAYSHNKFFKSNKPKLHIQDILKIPR
jgi:hypothetical protein